MKEKIKQYTLLSMLLVILVCTAGLFYYKYQEGQERKLLLAETQEQNYLFSKDVVYSLIKINNAFNQDGSDKTGNTLGEDIEFKLLQTLYATKEGLLDAKNTMEKWNSNENIQINKIANDMLQGMNDLIISTESFIRVATRESVSEKQDLAIFTVKLEQGRKKIMIAPINIGFEFSLSDNQKRELISYIEINFEKEIERWNEQIAIGEEPTMPAEAVAALMIKGGLEGIGKDWKKIEESF